MVSRIGKLPIDVPNGVEITLKGSDISVKGTKGTLEWVIPSGIAVEQDANILNVKAVDEARQTPALHGLSRSLIANMVEGVTNGFTKRLKLVGTGYRVAQKGSDVEVAVGYSHPVMVKAEEGVTLVVEDQSTVVVSGIDKQQVGEVAANIRKIRPPEPYKGKGIRYEGEFVRRKAGKAGK
jgi:large subunit ribosomal protein L6